MRLLWVLFIADRLHISCLKSPDANYFVDTNTSSFAKKSQTET